jgi:riboflavin biosynthesis pyrimidine reductase
MTALTPLDDLHDAAPGEPLPLPPELARIYGRLAFGSHPGRPYVVGNFVTTLDGVVSLSVPGMSGGGEISGDNPHDRLVMGLLRAAADAVIVGAGTLRAVPRHLWTAEHAFPPLADAYARLRSTLGKIEPPLNVIVTGSGEVDLGLRVFASGRVPVLIVTTAEGERRLTTRSIPGSTRVAVAGETGSIGPRAILDAVGRVRPGELILTEGGPRLIGDFFASRLLDDLFLTLAPQVAGRDEPPERPGLVEGQTFAPKHPLWGKLVGLKRGESHLFLRYSFDTQE